MPDVRLFVGGQVYGGWTTVRVARSIEQLAGTFELQVTDRWAGQDVRRPIRNGEACTVEVDGERVITGYVDDVAPEFGPDGRRLSVRGRGRTADLVDCAAIHASGQWVNADLMRVARDICAPFGLNVRKAADIGEAFGNEAAKIDEGETAFDFLDRLARMRAVLLTSDAQGDLVITRTGTGRAPAALIEGENLISARAQYSWRDRYSRYIVKGQDKGGDFVSPEQAAHALGEAVDSAIGRYRPTLVRAEDRVNTASAGRRARFERDLAIARSTRVTVTVRDWSAGGELWQPNTLAEIRSPMLGLDTTWLIVGVGFMQSDREGTRTELSLAPPAAFDLQAEPEPEEVSF
ncbi:phage baseplate assembly protein [Alkalilimnicola sp. S0819]|uniref:phage baseplate assembly protein n=1 Tax=Alkalilimnicola sp. S0819 TaxID=2613922 RepID=UPI001261C5A6|nr:contractile injection system protein, VgrG/Pvc8 family [Alkalilimnicola sp. S0819]KAB7624316.1 hypothetical protein F3N43_05775 [Alkalilimnicola sp. S0819]MPQ16140.1 hypothetical protein [Alkalilimnicola sp. S0819]